MAGGGRFTAEGIAPVMQFSSMLATLGLMLASAATAQQSNMSAAQEPPTEIVVAQAGPTQPQVLEPLDPITADENRVVEDKMPGRADADFIPGRVPEADMRVERTRGSNLDRDVSPEDVLITHDDMDLTPSTTKGPFYDASENELRGRKLARGLGNVFLCVAEVPNQAFQEAYRTSPIVGFVAGAGKGVWKGVKRLAIGTWEVTTFYFPGKNNYQPYIQPEVVFQEYLH